MPDHTQGRADDSTGEMGLQGPDVPGGATPRTLAAAFKTGDLKTALKFVDENSKEEGNRALAAQLREHGLCSQYNCLKRGC